MAVERHAHDWNGREDAAGEMHNLDGVGNHRVHDKLLKHNSHGDQNGYDREERHVFERVHGYESGSMLTDTLHHAQRENADKADRTNNDSAVVKVRNAREEECENIDEKIA